MLEGARQTPGALDRLCAEMEASHIHALWDVLGELVPAQPRPAARLAHWQLDTVRDFLLRSGELISAREAERRVLVLENPGLPGSHSITPNLYAGLQLVLPGEVTSSHRHTQSAFRLIVEGDGAYTTVNEARFALGRFDLLVTPSGSWHDHGNASGHPAIWLDGLDIPIVRQLGAGFCENRGARAERCDIAASVAAVQTMTPSPRLHAAGIAPERGYHYRFRDWSAKLRDAAASGPPDPHLGHRFEFVGAAQDRSLLPAISAFAQLMPAGFETRPRRATDSGVFFVVSGEGQVKVGDQTIQLETGDIVTVPSWQQTCWSARTELMLFEFSDRAIQQKLDLYREQSE